MGAHSLRVLWTRLTIRICMELELLLVLSFIDRDLFRDEFYGMHWFFSCGYYSIMHACMAMVEPAIFPSTIHAFLYCPTVASFG